MSSRNRRFTPAIVTLLIMLIAVGLAVNSAQILAYAGSCVSGGVTGIDVFTQKAPFDGRGANESSDMFGPQETVVLYGIVLVNGTPASGKLVTFEISGPTSMSRITAFDLVANSNASGVAETQFTLQIINQTDVFGRWTVTGTVEVAGNVYSDMLTFNVGWIIELLSVRTLYENLSDGQYFGKLGYVGVEIALRNNAMVEKTANIEATIFDVAQVPIDTVEIKNYTVPPNGKTWYVYDRLYIASYALVTYATIIVVALDNNGVAYCPGVSNTFGITADNPIYPNFADASVYLGFVPSTGVPGDVLTIPFVARNEGTLTLSGLDVSLNIGGSLVDSESVDSLDPYAYKTFNYVWNTTGLPDGTYTITANLAAFPEEADLSHNSYTTTVELATPTPIPVCIHDIQVTNVTCSKNEVYQGETVNIQVTVENDGNFTESTSVGAFYNGTLIQEENVTELAPGTESVLLFEWNTTNVPVGTYQISGTANPVEGQTDFEHLTYYDGLVKIEAAQVGLVSYTLTVNVVGNGTVTQNPLNTTYLSGTIVTLAAVAGTNWTFQGWSGDVTGTQNPMNITMNENKTVTATFTQLAQYYSLTVNVAGNGTVTKNPLNATYASGTNVTLTAVPSPNWTFQGWSGDVTGVQNPVNITMNGNKTVTATFAFVLGVHDIAITAVSASPSQVQAGEVVHVLIVAANLGDYSETFNVTVYYESNLIQKIPVISLLANSSETLAANWNTSNVGPGIYTISANATIVEGDVNPANNNFIDGEVTIVAPVKPSHFVSYWLLLFVFIVPAIPAGLASLMLLTMFATRKRKRRTRRTPEYVTIVHPHI